MYEDGGPVHLVDKISDDFVYEVDLGIEKNCIIPSNQVEQIGIL